jgi:hypothetical protein
VGRCGGKAGFAGDIEKFTARYHFSR